MRPIKKFYELMDPLKMYCYYYNYLSMNLFTYYLSIYSTIYLSVLSICLFIYLPIYLFNYLSIYLSIYPSIYLSIYLSIFRVSDDVRDVDDDGEAQQHQQPGHPTRDYILLINLNLAS